VSVKVSGAVWELDLDPIDKLVLLALVDHADHDGQNIRPGNKLLMAKTGLTRPTITDRLKKFVERGILITTSEDIGRGNKKEFSVETDHLALHPYFIEKNAKKREKSFPVSSKVVAHKKGQAAFPIQNEQKGKADNEKGKAHSEKGKADNSAPIRNAHVEPSEPSEEPSSVCVAHALGISEQDVLDWCKAKRKDLVKPEIYANKAWHGQWPNVIAEVSAWKAAQSAEQRSAQPDAPADGQVAVQASALVTALFAAKGWVLDRATPSQWDEARTVEAQLAVYEESSTPALVDFVTRSGEFYANAGKPRWLLGFLPNDWPQIYRWFNRADAKGNAYVGAHRQPENTIVESQTENHGELIELDRAEELAAPWLNNLPEIERERLFTDRRNQIFKKLPAARQWDADVLEQTIRSGLIREFIEQQQEVPHAA
jgi:hypothetical protein